MNKRILIKAVFDGLIQSLILVCLGIFSISEYASNLSLEQYLSVGALSAIFTSVVYIVLIPKEPNNKIFMYFSLLCIFCFVLSMVSVLAILLTLRLDLSSLRKVNNADGILILFITGGYLLASTILRVGVFVATIIKNSKKTD